MQKIRQLCISVCLIVLPMTVWSFSSSIDLDWSKNRTIGANTSYSPDVAINHAGDAVSVFIHFDGSHQRVEASVRPSGRHWGTLKPYLSTAGLDAEVPRVAISPNANEAFVVWKVNSNSQFIVQASVLNFDGKKLPALTNLTGPVDLGADPIIATDQQGNALAVWSVFDGSRYHIQSAMHYGRFYHCHHHPCKKDQWVMLDEIIVDGAFELDLSFDPAGNAVMVWEGRIGFKNVIQAATLRYGSHTWVRTADASPTNTQSNFPKVGTDKKGNAIVVWSEGVTLHHIAAAKLPFGSKTWISTSDPTLSIASSFPDLAVDPDGNAVAVWVRLDDSFTAVEASTLTSKSLVWSEPVVLANSLVITDPRVVVDKHGNTLSIWSASGSLQTALLLFDESWTVPETITPPTIGVGEQRIAITPHGFAVITYTAQVFSSSEEVVQAIQSIQ